MTFVESATTCMKDKYADFNGRASRSEYWWFVLFMIIVQIVLSILSAIVHPVLILLVIALLLPGIAVGVRRLHDIGKTGWLLLIGFIPLIGLILLYWAVQPSAEGANEYGAAPAATPE